MEAHLTIQYSLYCDGVLQNVTLPIKCGVFAQMAVTCELSDYYGCFSLNTQSLSFALSCSLCFLSFLFFSFDVNSLPFEMMAKLIELMMKMSEKVSFVII